MAEFFAFELIPILAMFWIGVGSLILVGAVALALHAFALGKQVRIEGTGEISPPREPAKLAAIFGSSSLFFVVLGFVFLELVERRAQGPQSILMIFGSLSVLGGILSVFLLRRELRLSLKRVLRPRTK